jgi:hypothetical protein
MPSKKRLLYPGEFTWRLDDQPSKRRKQHVRNSTHYRERVKVDNYALAVHSEKEVIATARER